LFEWINRHKKYGAAGLEKRARRSSRGLRAAEAIVEKVIETRKENPGMGAAKMSAHLGRFALLKVAANTISRIIKRHEEETPYEAAVEKEENQPAETIFGRVRRRRRSPKRNKPKQVRYFERSSPNTLWQMDIMTFMLKGQYRIYLIGVIDDYSRFIVSHGLFRRQTESNVMEVVRAGMEKYKSPKEILTDNGRQFYSWRGKSKFTKFCIKAGIQHIRSRPYHPQTLGKIESFWRNLYQEYLGETPLSSFEEAQAGIANWIRHYNYKRVHLGIGGLVPADRFFGVSNQVEKLMREGAEETEKALAENPGELKSPMYLVGKIGDREIRVVAKNGELVINEENAAPPPVEDLPEKDVELVEAETILHDGEDRDGRDKNGELRAAGSGVPIDGGPAAPADQRDGEAGGGAVGVEREEEGGGSVQGAAREQGRVLQVDEAGNGGHEESAETGGSGQESGADAVGKGANEGTGEGKQAAAEGKEACGNPLLCGEDAGGVAERGAGTESQ
jgi:transposase InsO family protein